MVFLTRYVTFRLRQSRFVRLSREGIRGELPVLSGLDVALECSVGRGRIMRDTATGAIYAIANAWKISGYFKQGTALIRLLPRNGRASLRQAHWPRGH